MSQLDQNVFSQPLVPGRFLKTVNSHSSQSIIFTRPTSGKDTTTVRSFFLIPSVSATDPDAICPLHQIACVECRSDLENYCHDPFNRSLLTFNQIRTRLCDGYCVKWIRASPNKKQGNIIVRTCSSNLRMKFQINLVCFQESKAGVILAQP
nr:unnamed protein product [Spirometra erinaceieuropaei]